MPSPHRTVAILGSTGSIGCSTLDVASASAGRIKIAGLTAHHHLDTLIEQARQFRPRWVVATDIDRANGQSWRDLVSGTEVLSGLDGIIKLVTEPEVDTVVSAIVGSAGLEGTWAALEAGKTVALANKESLVMAGPQVMQLARKHDATILPVDSEHSAIFQAMQAGHRDEVKRIVLTASGGPFRNHTKQQLQNVTVDEAFAHPTWNMGRKITVDSATMMNKSLEIIEARWLFDMDPDKIEVVVHPQSIVHSMVEFQDGSVLAQLSPPDMKLPIQYALTYPDRWESPAPKLDLSQAFQLEFEPPDYDRFPSLQLGQEVSRAGGTAGAVLNAANEAAVAAFLAGEIGFIDIVSACRDVLNQHTFDPSPLLSDLLAVDAWARKEVTKWICS